MDPAGNRERAVVEQVLGVGGIASVPGLVERLVDRVVGREGHQLVEVRNGPLQVNLERPVVNRVHTEFLQQHLSPVHRFGVLQPVENERVLRGVARIQNLAPRENEVVRCDRFPVAPAGFGTKPEGRLCIPDLPILRDAADQAVLGVVAQQALHGVTQDVETHRVGATGGIELRGLAAQGQGDRSGRRIHGLACAALVPLGQQPEQYGERRNADAAEIENLTERADIETGTRHALGDARTRGIGDLAHDKRRSYDTMRNRLPTMRFRCMSELHSSAWCT